MRFTQDDRLLFIGDSVTDTGRDREDPSSLGGGYVRLIAEAPPLLDTTGPDPRDGPQQGARRQPPP